jgi:L-threonylcarbamoyladenylate synthase
MTLVLKVDPEHPDSEAIRRAAAVILDGRLVAFPTETVYGLGANALDADAVSGIFRAKERPSYDPVIVHLADRRQLSLVVGRIPEIAWELARQLWPGPLTLVLERGSRIPSIVTAGGATVAVRVPAHRVARALVESAGVPIAAPSANRFGRVSPTRAEHVLADLAGRVDLVLDAGSSSVGVESTVLSLVESVPTILRPGGVSREVLERILGRVDVQRRSSSGDEPLASPGTMEKHYAPRAELVLYQGEREIVLPAMREAALRHIDAGERVGILVAEEDLAAFAGLAVFHQLLGSLDSLAEIAQQLYASLRSLDEEGVSVILARDFGESGLGLAIRDRLTRAAAGRVVRVTDQPASAG